MGSCSRHAPLCALLLVLRASVWKGVCDEPVEGAVDVAKECPFGSVSVPFVGVAEAVVPRGAGGGELAQCRGRVATVECGYDDGEAGFAWAFPVRSVGGGDVAAGGECFDAVGQGVGAGVGRCEAAVFAFPSRLGGRDDKGDD